jgi:kinesin family protein 1
MNATSSRSHTIIVITFAQINKADNTEKRSFVNLVDLAGSERQGDTKSEGKTLKEGANINASLTALGQVISSLVQKQNDPVKNKSMVIPYRNSTLTKLLANSLGGNSKTIMIGAISPAHDAYEGNIFYSNNQDTLSTLRFLDRAKGIKNVAVVNENAIDKLIRELKEENEALKRKLLADGGGGGDDADNDEIKRQIAEQEIAMRELNKTWAQKLEEAMMQKSLMDNDSKEEKKKREKMQTHPHLVNLNEDPLLSGMITHFIENGEHALGRNADATSTEIQLAGLNILPIHGYITRNAKNLILRPANGGQIRVNGKIIEENPDVDGNEEFNGVVLAHNDRVMFGLHQLFLIKFSGVVDGKEYAKITSYRHAQREIAAAEGYGAGDSGVSNALFETISEVLAAVQEANAIAEELMVPKRYVLVINKQDEDGGMGDLVSVKVKDFERHTKWMMSQAQFLEAQQHMKDMYVAYVEGGGLRSLSNWPEDKNPFNITAQDWLIGSGKATFKNLTSAMKIKETILLENQKGANEGLLKFSVEIKIEGLTDVLVSIDQLNQLDEKLRVEIMTESVTGTFYI